MPQVFADSGYWIALLQPEDQLHTRAQAVTLEIGDLKIVTTQMVLVEALTHIVGRGAILRNQAVGLVGQLESDPLVEIVPQTAAQFRAAVERYAARSDHLWSLTDCASFLVMEERGVTEALAYDRDFEQADFVALLRGGSA